MTTRPYEQEKFSLSVCVKLMSYALVHVSFYLLKIRDVYTVEINPLATRENGIIASRSIVIG